MGYGTSVFWDLLNWSIGRADNGNKRPPVKQIHGLPASSEHLLVNGCGDAGVTQYDSYDTITTLTRVSRMINDGHHHSVGWQCTAVMICQI